METHREVRINEISMIYALLIVLGTLGMVFALYFATRAALGPEVSEATQDLAGKVLVRGAALHSLILALVFASEVVEYNQLSAESSAEANAIADVFFDSARFDSKSTPDIQASIRDYLRVATGSEWQELGQSGRLSSEAWEHWDRVYRAVLDLDPQSEAEKSLRSNMLAGVAKIAETRDRRHHHATTGIGMLFWIAAISGVALSAIPFYVFAPTRENLSLISVYAGYMGLILFAIFAMANPFADPGALTPEILEQLSARLEAR